MCSGDCCVVYNVVSVVKAFAVFCSTLVRSGAVCFVLFNGGCVVKSFVVLCFMLGAQCMVLLCFVQCWLHSEAVCYMLFNVCCILFNIGCVVKPFGVFCAV